LVQIVDPGVPSTSGIARRTPERQASLQASRPSPEKRRRIESSSDESPEDSASPRRETRAEPAAEDTGSGGHALEAREEQNAGEADVEDNEEDEEDSELSVPIDGRYANVAVDEADMLKKFPLQIEAMKAATRRARLSVSLESSDSAGGFFRESDRVDPPEVSDEPAGLRDESADVRGRGSSPSHVISMDSTVSNNSTEMHRIVCGVNIDGLRHLQMNYTDSSDEEVDVSIGTCTREL
jgi:hypothetical protein